MSKYTTEVRFICENSAGLSKSEGADNVDSVLDKCWNKIFNFDFPIFDENYRQVLCRKILKHYYTREIAHETVGRWKLALNAKLNEIMPYYNQLYKSELLEFNPFYDVDLTRSREGSGTSNKTSNNTETNSGTRLTLRSGSVLARYQKKESDTIVPLPLLYFKLSYTFQVYLYCTSIPGTIISCHCQPVCTNTCNF